MRIYLRTTIWILSLAGLGLLSLSAAGYKQQAAVHEIRVQLNGMGAGEYFLTEADLVEQTRAILDMPGPQNIGVVDLEMLEESMYHHPYIRNVEAYISGNNTLTLKVTQREPLFRVFDRRGASYYVDREGVKLPLSKYYTARVPVATAVNPFPEAVITKDNTNAWHLYEVMLFIDSDPFLRSLTEQVYQNADGTLVLVTVLSDAIVTIGDTEDLNVKFNKLKLFLQEVLPEAGWDTFASIDLSYAGQVVCKRHPGK